MADTIIHSRSGYRRLDKLRHVQGTSRILNLIQLEKNLENDLRAASAVVATDRRKGSAKFFSNETLNRAIFMKHNLRADEVRLFIAPRPVETKVFIPFERERLEIGGQSFFVGEIAYHELLANMLRLDPDSSDAKTKRDLKILNILRILPSFDPFILRERLRMEGVKVDRRYFSASYDQTKTATEAVFADFRPLIESAIGKRATNDELSRFVDQVWNVTENSKTNIFFEALRIPQTEWLDIVFAWKALLFYRLEGRKANGLLSLMIDSMKTVKIHQNHNMSSVKDIRVLERRIAKNLLALKHRAVTYVENTAQALMNAVSHDFDSSGFRNMLRELSSSIVSLGTDFTVFDQVVSYYLYLYKQRGTPIDGSAYEMTLISLDEILALRVKT